MSGFFKGNEHWKKRARHGRPTKLTPDELMSEFMNYIKWIEENPLCETKPMVVDKMVEMVEIPKMRPYSVVGFCLYAGISFSTFVHYKKNKDFVEVTTYVEETVRTQQISGAASGFLNANIIARLNGLVDKKEVKKDTVKTKYTPEEREARLKKLMEKKNNSTFDENDELF